MTNFSTNVCDIFNFQQEHRRDRHDRKDRDERKKKEEERPERYQSARGDRRSSKSQVSFLIEKTCFFYKLHFLHREKKSSLQNQNIIKYHRKLHVRNKF